MITQDLVQHVQEMLKVMGLPYQVVSDNHNGERQYVAAAFAAEPSKEAYLGMCYRANEQDRVDYMVEYAMNLQNSIELSGMEDDLKAEGHQMPYDALITALEVGLKRAKYLKAHRHSWVINPEHDTSYCSTCGQCGDI